MLTNVVNVFYPLGDVAIFALALTLILTPGHLIQPTRDHAKDLAKRDGGGVRLAVSA